jgi:SAM-dependent methyltransferase
VLTYPAPERNKGPILEVLQRVLPTQGRILEVASGTGQHIVHFARAMPQLHWQPSDPEAAHLESIQARIDMAALSNIAAPLMLDVCDRPWRVQELDAILCINMIHIAPWRAALALLEEAGRLLTPGGVLYLYGPYQREGRHTAPSNEAFDADLRGRDPEWGVRNLEDVEQHARTSALALGEVVQMPANNLSLVFRRTT